MSLVYIGRAWGQVFAQRRSNALAKRMEHAVKQELPDVQHVPEERPTIMRAYENSNSLLDTMLRRARRLEDYIAAANEELRQVTVVIDGATKLRDTLAAGMDVPAGPSPLTPFWPDSEERDNLADKIADDIERELSAQEPPAQLRAD